MFARIFARKKPSVKNLPASEHHLQTKLCLLVGWSVCSIFELDFGLVGLPDWIIGGMAFRDNLGFGFATRLSIDRKIHLPWAQVGDWFQRTIILKNKSRLPAVWVEIIDEFGIAF